jgi:hypothetical protein
MAVTSSIVSGVIGQVLESGSKSGDSSAKDDGMVSGGLGTNILGDAVGDPAGFIFNQIRYNQDRDYRKKIDSYKTRLLQLQADRMELENDEVKRKKDWNNNLRRYMLGGGR